MALNEAIIVPRGNTIVREMSPEREADLRAEWATYVAPIPQTVSAAQAESALYDAGLYDAYVSAVALHDYPPIRIWAAKANVWERKHPYIAAVAQELGITDAEIDALFIAASKK